ncbi:serine hydroxymethyltransferase [Klebsiella pneumoniae]|nr:serine hydroxymethyltransferase [Klebsiella pneumoniae]
MLKREMNIADYDAELWQAMEQEKVRQEEHIELIASETTPVRALCRRRALS